MCRTESFYLRRLHTLEKWKCIDLKSVLHILKLFLVVVDKAEFYTTWKNMVNHEVWM